MNYTQAKRIIERGRIPGQSPVNSAIKLQELGGDGLFLMAKDIPLILYTFSGGWRYFAYGKKDRSTVRILNTYGFCAIRFQTNRGKLYWYYTNAAKPFWTEFKDGLSIGQWGNLESPAHPVTKTSIHVFDNGGATYDRYTVVFPDGSIYGMSHDADTPNGVCAFDGYCHHDTANKAQKELQRASFIAGKDEEQTIISHRDLIGIAPYTLPEGLLKQIKNLQFR